MARRTLADLRNRSDVAKARAGVVQQAVVDAVNSDAFKLQLLSKFAEGADANDDSLAMNLATEVVNRAVDPVAEFTEIIVNRRLKGDRPLIIQTINGTFGLVPVTNYDDDDQYDAAELAVATYLQDNPAKWDEIAILRSKA